LYSVNRRQDQHTLDAPPQKQLAQDQSRFDCFAKAHVVRDEQIHTRHRQRLQQRDELKVFDLHGPVERARDRQALHRSLASLQQIRTEAGSLTATPIFSRGTTLARQQG
jgi:hypothetical protein